MASIEMFGQTSIKQPEVWNIQGAKIYWTFNGYNGGKQISVEKSVAEDTSKAKTFYTLTDIQISYQRPGQLVYPLGGGAPIHMLGNPTGTITLTSLIGPTTDLYDFIDHAGNNCDSVDFCIVPFGKKCAGQTQVPKFYVYGGKTQNFGMSMQSGQGGYSTMNGRFDLLIQAVVYNQADK